MQWAETTVLYLLTPPVFSYHLLPIKWLIINRLLLLFLLLSFPFTAAHTTKQHIGSTPWIYKTPMTQLEITELSHHVFWRKQGKYSDATGKASYRRGEIAIAVKAKKRKTKLFEVYILTGDGTKRKQRALTMLTTTMIKNNYDGLTYFHPLNVTCHLKL